MLNVASDYYRNELFVNRIDKSSFGKATHELKNIRQDQKEFGLAWLRRTVDEVNTRIKSVNSITGNIFRSGVASFSKSGYSASLDHVLRFRDIDGEFYGVHLTEAVLNYLNFLGSQAKIISKGLRTFVQKKGHSRVEVIHGKNNIILSPAYNALLFHDSLEDGLDHKNAEGLSDEEKIDIFFNSFEHIKKTGGRHAADFVIDVATKISKKPHLEQLVKTALNDKLKIGRLNFVGLLAGVIKHGNGVYLHYKASEMLHNIETIEEMSPEHAQRKAIEIGNYAIACLACGFKALGKQLLEKFLWFIYCGKDHTKQKEIGSNFLEFEKRIKDKVDTENIIYLKQQDQIRKYIFEMGNGDINDIQFSPLPIWDIHSKITHIMKDEGEVLGEVNGYPVLTSDNLKSKAFEDALKKVQVARIKVSLENDTIPENIHDNVLSSDKTGRYKTSEERIEVENNKINEEIDKLSLKSLGFSVTDSVAGPEQPTSLKFDLYDNTNQHNFEVKVVNEIEDVKNNYGEAIVLNGVLHYEVKGLSKLFSLIYMGSGINRTDLNLFYELIHNRDPDASKAILNLPDEIKSDIYHAFLSLTDSVHRHIQFSMLDPE